ncbi:hypothetical protein LTR10_018901 [Elasticomyces elasticus]|uniref:Uncharacterized protein n=1 Tax=Exophiala sideris TaxID=1016849 RepID=A0ABR0JK66_9EURO|nr:hypothetical protein LTR10_018901 [Elasticomyces elasticus]KAK5034454.1 hypothetical protein LTS07_003375 [Exophiala sideris]KAK5042751.1 hypothetical protein LTR13_001599 [Exophiala sideris]KAK5065834.1 hypothetical protein LTR69_003384 [Exophiala sideris]KAK5185705.1 hypothetical protein LTR44_001754 [Eurotiomycetes sp. CCFEE 6388]
MSSYPGESQHTWSRQPAPSYYAPGTSVHPHQAKPPTELQPFQNAYENGGALNWQGSGHSTHPRTSSETLPMNLPYPQISTGRIHRGNSWESGYQHPSAAFPAHPYEAVTIPSPVMMPQNASQYEQQSQIQGHGNHNYTAGVEASWQQHAAGTQRGFALHGEVATAADPPPAFLPSASGQPWNDCHQPSYYSDSMGGHPGKDFYQAYETTTHPPQNACQTHHDVDYVDGNGDGDGDGDLQALDFRDALPGSIIQRRIQAMATSMDEDDMLQSNQVIVVSQFFRDLKEEVYLANIKNKTDGEVLKDDPIFADIPQDWEVTTFKELDTRKRILLSSMAFDAVDNDLQSFTSIGGGHPGQNADHRALSAEQEERLATLGVSGLPKPVQPYDPSKTTGAPDQPPYDLRSVNDTHREQMHPIEPQETNVDHHRVQPADNEGRKQNNYNQSSKNKKKKDRRKRQNQQYQQQGRAQARNRARSPSTSSNQHYNHRQDYARPPPSGQSQQRSNEQGRKRAYEEPRQYVRGGDGDTPGKRRKRN